MVRKRKEIRRERISKAVGDPSKLSAEEAEKRIKGAGGRVLEEGKNILPGGREVTVGKEQKLTQDIRKTFREGIEDQTPEGRVEQEQQEKLSILQNVAKVFNLIDDPFQIQKAAEEHGEGLIAPTIPLGVGAVKGGIGIAGKTGQLNLNFAKVEKGKTVIEKRAIVGQLSKTQNINPKIAAGYQTNTKSQAITKNWLLGAGFTVFAADKLVDAFGTYPWAAHNNREATDTLTFGMRKALNVGNIQEYDRLSEEFDVMVENMPSAWAQLPYENVVKSSVQGIKNAVSVKNSMDVERAKLQGGIKDGR